MLSSSLSAKIIKISIILNTIIETAYFLFFVLWRVEINRHRADIGLEPLEAERRDKNVIYITY